MVNKGSARGFGQFLQIEVSMKFEMKNKVADTIEFLTHKSLKF